MNSSNTLQLVRLDPLIRYRLRRFESVCNILWAPKGSILAVFGACEPGSFLLHITAPGLPEPISSTSTPNMHDLVPALQPSSEIQVIPLENPESLSLEP